MNIVFFSDPIEMEQLVFTLRSDGIAVLITTRLNAKTIWSEAKSLLDGTLLHLSVEGHDYDWYHYLLLLDVAEIEIEDANALVKIAAQLWEKAGYPSEFVANVDHHP